MCAMQWRAGAWTHDQVVDELPADGTSCSALVSRPSSFLSYKLASHTTKGSDGLGTQSTTEGTQPTAAGLAWTLGIGKDLESTFDNTESAAGD